MTPYSSIMAAWSSQAALTLSHQECKCANVNKFDGAPPLCFVKPAQEAGLDDADLEVHQVKIKVNNNHLYSNLFVNGTSELALNHVITYNDLIKHLSLSGEVQPLNTLLIVEKEAYAELQKANKKEKRKLALQRKKRCLR